MTEDKKFLGISDILGLDDREVRDVYVPMWGTHCRLRSMTGKERDRFEMSLRKEVPARGGKVKEVKNMDNVRARLLAVVWVDPVTGDPMVRTPEQIVALGGKNAAALELLFDAACEMNGLKETDVKELVGNSEEEDGTSSSSDSPTNSAELEASY